MHSPAVSLNSYPWQLLLKLLLDWVGGEMPFAVRDAALNLGAPRLNGPAGAAKPGAVQPEGATQFWMNYGSM